MKCELDGLLFSLSLEALRDKERIITKHAVDQFNKKWTQDSISNGYNVKLDTTPELQTLWRIFTRVSDQLFCNLEVIEDEKFGEAWAYVQNSERNYSIWHNHLYTSSINGVYYSNVPDPTGTLSLGHLQKEYILEPKQGTLYIWPGWMNHKPNPQENSLEPRVSINVELLTSTRPQIRPEIMEQFNIPVRHEIIKSVMW